LLYENISKVTFGDNQKKYEYDELNRIISCSVLSSNKSFDSRRFIYSYNKKGLIKKKKMKFYSEEDSKKGIETTFKYEYEFW